MLNCFVQRRVKGPTGIRPVATRVTVSNPPAAYRARLGVACFAAGLPVPHSSLAQVPSQYLETPLAAAFGEPPTIGAPMLAPEGASVSPPRLAA